VLFKLYPIGPIVAVLGLVATLAAVVAPVAPAIAYNATAPHAGKYLDNWMEYGHKRLDGYWSPILARSAKKPALPSPGFSWINQTGGTQTGCGVISLDDAPNQDAFYCEDDRVLYFNADFLKAVDSDFGWPGVEAVVAHEYGHHLQKVLHIGGTTFELEQQADCLSGSAMSRIFGPTEKTKVDVDQMKALFNMLGDDKDHGDAGHGLGAQRVIAFMRGWNGDTAWSPKGNSFYNLCDLPLLWL